MKINRLLLAFAGVVTAFASALASPQFIQHRQDCFKAVPTSEDQIIFLGNSITNFHNWADAFVRPEGVALDRSLISNRGISDERAYHWKHNVQMMLDGEKKPAKIFIGIGTNDLNVGLPPEAVANDIRAIVRQIQISSPQTEIHVQSILPRNGAINDVVTRTIPLLEAMAEEMGVDFINLTETMNALGAPNSWAYDGLHPTGKGYRAWCRFIAPKVGLDCAYVDGDVNTGGFGGIAGVHAGQYGLMPVTENDILILGDPWTDAVQWHEFFGNANVRSRSIGNGNLTVANVKTLIYRSLKANSAQKTPRAIVLCWGANRTGTNLNASTIKADYESLVAYAQAAAPGAQIIVCQTPPTTADGHAANEAINTITAAPVADLEAKGMTVETVSGWNMSGGLGSKAVVMAAQAVGEAINAALGASTVKIPSMEEFEVRYANRNRRIEVAKCYNALYQHRLACEADVQDALAQIEEILKGNTVTAEQVAQAQSIRDAKLQELVFHPDTEKWYHISSPRNFEGGNASVASLAHSGSNPYLFDNKLTADTTDGSDIWAFRQRPDGTYDIVSYDGYYLISGNTLTLSKVYPTEGWTIEGGSAETGTYIISSGNVHLHRDNQNNLINYWKKGDTGCDFYITEFPGELPEIEEKIAEGWVTLRIESGYNVNNTGVGGKNVLNHPVGVKRNNGFYELTVGDVDADKPANAFFRLSTNEDGNWSIHGLTGHAFKEDAVAVRTGSEKTLGVNRIDLTTYNIGYWVPFLENGDVLMGKFGSNRAVYTVETADVNNYDIWTVSVFATENDLNENNGSQIANIINDTHVTLDIPANKGVATVYNGGTFFLEPGTEFTAEDLTVVCPNLANQSQDHPDVVIDTTTKTIYIDYTEGLPNGWYTFELHSMEGSNNTAKNWLKAAQDSGLTNLVNTDKLYDQNNGNFYPMGFCEEPQDHEPRTFFYLSSAGDNIYNMRTLHGYYIKDSATASYEPVELSTPPHATADDVFKTTFMVWDHNLSPKDITYLAGKFNNNYTYYTIKPAEIDYYDVYEVHMIEGYHGAKMTGDATLTLDSDLNQGITTVCDNGTFFVTKGAELTPEMFVASSLTEAKPTITIEPGLITVSYLPVILEAIELDRTTVELKEGENVTLVATLTPENPTNATIFWASSDEEVATVDENGTVTAVGPGTATITAFQGELSAECQVTILKTETPVEPDPVEISISNPSLTLTEGQTAMLTATLTNAPEAAVVIWSSSDEAIATVDENGTVTAVAAGSASITATYGDASASCAVTVEAATPVTPDPVEISISEPSLTLTEGQTAALTATLTNAPEDAVVTWSSSDETIATVDENGTVTAVAAGSASITATYGDASASCAVTVEAATPVTPDPVEISISEPSLTLTEGQTAMLTATLTNAPEDAVVAWTSSNELVATVAADGTVTAVASGNAVITATYGDVSASCAVTVEAKTETPEDSINEITLEDEIKIYDLQGRRVVRPAGGIYIRNGKKIAIK